MWCVPRPSWSPDRGLQVIGQLRLLAPDPADRVPDLGADRLAGALGVVTTSLTVAASLSAIHTVASVVSTRRRMGPAGSRGSSKTTSPGCLLLIWVGFSGRLDWPGPCAETRA